MGSGNRGLYSGAVTSVVSVGSIDYMSPGDTFSQNIKRRKDIDANGFYDLIAHGTSKTILIEHNGAQVEITHRALTRLIANDPRIQGKSIRLLSCNTGRIPNGFAQGLADRLGVTVSAPNDYLWADRAGGYFVAAGKKVGDELRPVYSKPGKFQPYTPHRRKKK